jgi:glycosyltransferase involved in cell wall biosynthesis
VATAAGVLCNGLPTYASYRTLNDRCHAYFESRITEDLVIDEGALETRLAGMLAGGPLRLAFSDRLIAAGGADDLPKLANELRRLGVPFSLSVFGAGSYEPAIRIAISRDDLAGQVQLKGVLPFETGLLPYLKESVDLFVCPHRLGGPSCSYLESLSCGVPIVGYANEAWGLLLSTADVGRSAPLDDWEGLARAISILHGNREKLARLSLQAWEFAKRHTFERSFAGRIEHLRRCAELPIGETSLAAS